jgi:hypothetical protein
VESKVRAGTSLETTAGVLDHNLKNVGNSVVVSAAAGIQMVGISDSAGIALSSVVKGTQAAHALGVQDLKDSGRTYVTFILDNIAGVTTEALTTMTINKGGVVTTGTQYTVTAGKTFRVQAMIAAVLSGANNAAQSVRVRLRSATTVTVTSGILCSLMAGIQVALIGTVGNSTEFVADGLEIAGGQQLGLSQIASATTASVAVCVVGFEY